jgi:primosomal protein N' (replication factor Y)
MSSGIVVELTDTTDVPRLKTVRNISETYLPETLLTLTRWMAAYYGCSVGEAAQSVLPPLLKRSKRRERMSGTLCLNEVPGGFSAVAVALKRARRQLELAESLERSGGRAALRTVLDVWNFDSAQVRALIDKGIAVLQSGKSESPLDAMEEEVLCLNPDQETALDKIIESLSDKRFAPMLLHGVTGSGKTELYLRAARFTLSRGGGCIVLVPEIGLLPQAIARYQRVFGDRIAILHSRLTGAERFEMWRRIENGDCRLVLGPRSAVFSPVKDLQLIVVDEEQDDSYKQEDKPRYHARSVALMRGKHENLTVVLGSATPSAESLHHALTDQYTHLSLPERVGGAALPEIRYVDMRTAETEGAFFSTDLLERLEHNIENNHQTILFLNKRGHARFVQCNACGWVARCENCDISLTFHRVMNRLKCHFCGFNRTAVKRCPDCGSARLYFSGVGTQRVELDLASFFPGVGVLRMDADTTSGKEGHRRVLEEFSTGKYPILIGTQMVAKGHHFPRVNLVGVLFAEESLNYPDFRSSEKTFQQLIQVAGRAGRGSAGAEVIIQTYMPEHHVFAYLRSHDYEGFMKEELRAREQLSYPPFSRVILACCVAAQQDVLERVVERWAGDVRSQLQGKPVSVLGPVPPLVARVKNRFRLQLLIKGRLTTAEKSSLLRKFAAATASVPGGRSVELRWDVDPESLS